MISIITPVYNTEKYLGAAINSVIAQSYSDWELILIDDGSTDSSPQICDRFAKNNPKIKVIHKKNGGLSSARNAGLEVFNGEFITFLDSDDELPSDALNFLIETQSKTNADIVCGEYKNFRESVPSCKKIDYKPKILSSIKAVEKILYQKELNNSVCGKLFRAGLWKNMRFREGLYYEDLDIFYKIFLRANYIAAISSITYFYRQHSGSYVHTFNLRRSDMLTVTDSMVEFMKNNFPSLLPAAVSRRLSANFNMLMLLYANESKIRPEDFNTSCRIEENCWDKIRNARKAVLYNPQTGVKNKAGILASYMGGKRILRILGKIFY